MRERVPTPADGRCKFSDRAGLASRAPGNRCASIACDTNSVWLVHLESCSLLVLASTNSKFDLDTPSDPHARFRGLLPQVQQRMDLAA